MPRNVSKADKTVRCIALLIALARAERGIQLRPFFERRGWCWRSAYRDLDTLRRASVPVEQQERGWFRVADGWIPAAAIDVKRDELAALFAARRLAPGLPELDALWSKLSGPKQLSLELDGWLDTRAPSIDYGRHRFALEEVQRATRERHVLRLHYRSATGDESSRLVEPAFVRWEPSVEAFYMIAWCRTRAAIRTFAIAPRRDALDEMSKAFRLWARPGVEHVSLRFTPRVAREVCERRWHASETICETAMAEYKSRWIPLRLRSSSGCCSGTGPRLSSRRRPSWRLEFASSTPRAPASIVSACGARRLRSRRHGGELTRFERRRVRLQRGSRTRHWLSSWVPPGWRSCSTGCSTLRVARATRNVVWRGVVRAARHARQARARARPRRAACDAARTRGRADALARARLLVGILRGRSDRDRTTLARGSRSARVVGMARGTGESSARGAVGCHEWRAARRPRSPRARYRASRPRSRRHRDDHRHRFDRELPADLVHAVSLVLRPLQSSNAAGDLGAARAPGFIPRGDGTLQLLRPHGALAAADEIAAALAALSHDISTLVIGPDSVLDAALARHGVPRVGADLPTPASAALLRACIESAFQPTDAAELHALICADPGPVPRNVAWGLSGALRKFAGRGSDAWRDAHAGQLAVLDDGARDAVTARMTALLDPLAPRDGTIAITALEGRMQTLASWARGRGLMVLATRTEQLVQLVRYTDRSRGPSSCAYATSSNTPWCRAQPARPVLLAQSPGRLTP